MTQAARPKFRHDHRSCPATFTITLPGEDPVSVAMEGFIKIEYGNLGSDGNVWKFRCVVQAEAGAASIEPEVNRERILKVVKLIEQSDGLAFRAEAASP